MSGQAISVTELNNYIKGLVEQDAMLANVCVRGELSNYKIYPSGHHYFTLKDSESSLRCVMFKSSASKLRFRPESGMGVTAWGRVAVYPRDGALFLLVVQEIRQIFLLLRRFISNCKNLHMHTTFSRSFPIFYLEGSERSRRPVLLTEPACRSREVDGAPAFCPSE